MATWIAMDGHTYTERELETFPTEAEARAFVVGLGASLVKRHMGTAHYRADRRAFRISRIVWRPGFVVTETVRAK